MYLRPLILSDVVSCTEVETADLVSFYMLLVCLLRCMFSVPTPVPNMVACPVCQLLFLPGTAC